MEFVILNGNIINRSEASIDIEDRGYQFGDGVYEVIRVYNGKMFTAQEHLERILLSAKKIGMEITFTVEEMKTLLAELIQKNNVQLGTIYMQFSRGVSPRNHPFPVPAVPQSFVAYTKEIVRPLANLENGVKAILKDDIRWLLCDIKSLNLLGNIMAKQEAVAAGCYEAIQHRGDIVTEGSSSNISIIKDGKMHTHPADNLILNGITRRKIIEVCEKGSIPYVEAAFTLADLENADEVFLSSTTSEITPIVEIDGKQVGNGMPGPVTKKIQVLFDKEIETECGSLKANMK
ncbi:D-alanine transaminase [Cytobacillus horneckiae]|uniref:D-alanine aminotransferase n=1 Tax=Cytobacillus horneckiae TaxID=549687 RepID=A0A2N0ZNE3_9BACI|nr:D-amino-acid transaminase [Cytobacillus horneckiae]MBN6889372.1 D-amino-acid transaminase [Cytobacillus horneckiae]MCM3179501.1 D-amino-acid transaminase [Cytobacillus horneckiae]MEC1154926.1 D-amino-acid transaminase [Cytobacillus horneckiae]MED2936168.1 D-amino-acid transaminase [Cytobacillus horneckiae]PKG31040.1 D-amino-acid transaminase [Cytobacillus horneckiae]